ncbi:thioredoxin-like protein [Parasitella parasitica]|nr:thioredoxin-like protein [Parasitella parasitica]
MASVDHNKLTLCGALFCPYVQRARIALAELGVDYNFVIIDAKNKPSWYLDIFPEGKIPCLIDENSHAIPDSLTIVQYLCERFSDKKSLISAEILERADSRYAIEFYGSTIGADYNNYLKTCGEEGSFRRYKMVMNAHLFRLDQLLKAQPSTGPYFLGKDFSYADIGMASFVIRMLTFNKHMLDEFQFSALEACPRVATYFEALISRPSVQETFLGAEEYLSWLKNDHHVALPTKK